MCVCLHVVYAPMYKGLTDSALCVYLHVYRPTRQGTLCRCGVWVCATKQAGPSV